VDILVSQLSAATSGTSTKEQEVADLILVVNGLKADIEKISLERDALVLRATAAEACAAEAQEASTRSADAMNAQLQQFQASLVSSNEEKAHTIQQLRQENEDLKASHAAWKAKSDDLASKGASLESCNSQLARDLEKSENRCKGLSEKLAGMACRADSLEKQQLGQAQLAESQVRRLTAEAELAAQKILKLQADLNKAGVDLEEMTKRKEEYKQTVQVAKEKLLSQKSLRDQETASARQEISRLSDEVKYWHERAQKTRTDVAVPQKENVLPSGVERLSKKLRTE
jgi:chromosome segregation ATPase